MTRLRRPAWLRYSIALAAVALVTEIRIYCGNRGVQGMDGPPFMMMLAGVFAAALLGGMGPGALAAVVGAGVCDYLFIEPKRSLLVGTPIGYDFKLALFVVEGLF